MELKQYVDIHFLDLSSIVMVRTSRTDQEAEEAADAVLKHQELKEAFSDNQKKK